MSGLRTLALCYLASASAFGAAAALQAHPQIGATAGGFRQRFAEKIWSPAVHAMRAEVALLDAPDTRWSASPLQAHKMLAMAPGGANDARDLAHFALPTVMRQPVVEAPREGPQFAEAAPVAILPDLPEEKVAPKEKPLPRMTQAKPPALLAALTPEQGHAEARLISSLTPEMRAHFDLFLFVSKASKGPLSQRMYVFRKNGSDLKLVYDWAASTGREKFEVSPRGLRSFTATPSGFYQLDPTRMYAHYRSYSWDQSMPYAMFFNWQREGLQSGLAIHAASGKDVALLGHRASAGCVHLAEGNARTLFNLIRSDYRGTVPGFAFDQNDTMRTDGQLAHDAKGRLKMAAGYKVLIDIENYGGADSGDAVAALF